MTNQWVLSSWFTFAGSISQQVLPASWLAFLPLGWLKAAAPFFPIEGMLLTQLAMHMGTGAGSRDFSPYNLCHGCCKAELVLAWSWGAAETDDEKSYGTSRMEAALGRGRGSIRFIVAHLLSFYILLLTAHSKVLLNIMGFFLFSPR